MELKSILEGTDSKNQKIQKSWMFSPISFSHFGKLHLNFAHEFRSEVTSTKNWQVPNGDAKKRNMTLVISYMNHVMGYRSVMSYSAPIWSPI